MAGIIPQLNQNPGPGYQNPVPIHNPQAAGIADEAQASAWGNVGRAAGAIGEHFEKQQEMEDRVQEEVYSNRVKDGLMLAKDKAQRESANDGSDFMQKFDQNFQEMQPDLLNGVEKYPGASVKVKKYQDMAYNSVKTSVLLDTAKMKETDNYQTMEGLADKSADRIRGNPKPEMAEAELKSYGNMLDDLVSKGTMTPKNRVKIMDAYKSKAAQQFVEGLSESNQYSAALKTLQSNQENPGLFTNISPADAKSLGFIDSTKQKELESSGSTYDVPVMTKGGKNQLSPAMSEIMNGMDPKTKSHYIDSLKAKAQVEGAVRLSEVHAQIAGFEHMAMNGGTYTDDDLGKLKAQVNSNPYLDADSRVRLNSKINTADAANKTVSLLSSTPRDKWPEVMAGFDKRAGLASDEAAKFDPKMGAASKDFAVQGNLMETKEKLQKYVAQVAKVQDEHAAEYVLGTDKNVNLLFKAAASGRPDDVQNYATATLAKQAYLGIEPSNQKVVPNAMASADMLKNQPSGADASKMIDDLQAKWGPYFPRAMGEITGQDKTLQKYMTTVYASPQVRAVLADSIRNEKAINSAFMASPEAAQTHASIRQQANMQLEPLQQAIMNGSNSVSRQGVVNSMRDAIELQVRREAIKPGADIPKITEDAYKNTIESQFQFENGGKSNALVPKQIQGMNIEPGIVSAFLRAHSTPEGIGELNPMVPSSYKAPGDFHEAISREGRWLTNDQFDGMQLKLRNPETGNFMPVLDKFGKQIEVKYHDINLSPSASTKNQSNFLGRMFSNINQGANWLDKSVAPLSN